MDGCLVNSVLNVTRPANLLSTRSKWHLLLVHGWQHCASGRPGGSVGKDAVCETTLFLSGKVMDVMY